MYHHPLTASNGGAANALREGRSPACWFYAPWLKKKGGGFYATSSDTNRIQYTDQVTNYCYARVQCSPIIVFGNKLGPPAESGSNASAPSSQAYPVRKFGNSFIIAGRYYRAYTINLHMIELFSPLNILQI
jgi:hypothetical protein